MWNNGLDTLSVTENKTELKFKNGDKSMEFELTPRGFKIGKISDLHGNEISLQESSSVIPRVWFGIGDFRMHLNVEQVQAIVVEMERFRDRHVGEIILFGDDFGFDCVMHAQEDAFFIGVLPECAAISKLIEHSRKVFRKELNRVNPMMSFDHAGIAEVVSSLRYFLQHKELPTCV